MAKFDSVDDYLAIQDKWLHLMREIRKILLATELEETLKWNTPHYTYNKKIVIGFVGFKNHLGIWFHHGVFLKDKAKKLITDKSSNARGLRQWRLLENEKLDSDLFRSYVFEAIENQKAGKIIKPVPVTKAKLPIELTEALDKNKTLQSKFEKLTPGRQNEYAAHIGSAKQEKTRLSRLEKAIVLIEKGLGLNDKYRA